MSRSPYDPSPSYTHCRHCERQYDNSGYYGTDDQSHYCEEKARVHLRMMLSEWGAGHVRFLLKEVVDGISKEQDKQARERLEWERKRDESELAEAEEKAQKLRQKLGKEKS